MALFGYIYFLQILFLAMNFPFQSVTALLVDVSCYLSFQNLPFQPNATGEQKTKPTQNSVRALRGLGLSPDLVSQ